MKAIKKLLPNSVYLLQGKAVANNNYFEKEQDVLLAHRFIRKYLSGMLDVMEYAFSDTGWALIIKTKDSARIEKVYLDRRNRSNKAKEHCIKIHPSDMLSEHIRYFLSALVKRMNMISGRTGSKVHSVFTRFVFESEEEYRAYVKDMHNENIKLCEQIERYKADKGEISEFVDKLGKGNVLFCSKHRFPGDSGIATKRQLIGLKSLMSDVLGKFIQNTYYRSFLHPWDIKT